ncbi:MAG: hypothetical protein D6820_17315 [Lentisphaerae bacterium]|nr:MAG: hypothetical protein D6820_17315 [Lentisphaerota bacterium]
MGKQVDPSGKLRLLILGCETYCRILLQNRGHPLFKVETTGEWESRDNGFSEQKMQTSLRISRCLLTCNES